MITTVKTYKTALENKRTVYKSTDLDIYTGDNKNSCNYQPSFNSSIHSKVISNWKGLRNGDGLSSTTTLHSWTLAIFSKF